MSESNAAALEARAKALRDEFERDLVAGEHRASEAISVLRQAQYGAIGRAEMAELGAKVTHERIAELRADNDASRAEIEEAQRNGLDQRVAELREAISLNDRQIDRLGAEAAHQDEAAAAARTEAAEKAAEADRVVETQQKVTEQLLAAEKEIDDIETKAAYLREADAHDAEVARLEREVAELRVAGRDDDADARTHDLVAERIAADAKRGSADEIAIDESTFAVLDLPAATGASAAAPTDAARDASRSMDPVYGAVDPSAPGPLGTATPPDALPSSIAAPPAASDAPSLDPIPAIDAASSFGPDEIDVTGFDQGDPLAAAPYPPLEADDGFGAPPPGSDFGADSNLTDGVTLDDAAITDTFDT